MQLSIKGKHLALPLGLIQSLVVVFGNTMGTGVSALSMILISRVLGPEKFGEFSVGFAIALMLNRINDLGLSYAVQKYASQSTDKAEINRLFSLSTKLKLIASALTGVIGVLAYSYLNSFLNFDQPLIILAAFILSSCTVMYEHVQAMLQSLHRFTQLVVINFIQAAFKLGGALSIMVLQFPSSVTIFAWYLVTPLIPVALSKLWFPSWVKLNLSDKFGKEKTLISSMAMHSAVAFISAGVVENIDVLFVQRYLTTYETGLLGGASKVAMLFSLVAYSLGNVLNPRVARYKTKKDVSSFIRKSFLLMLGCLVGFFCLVPLSGLMINLTIGPSYLPGVYILNYLLAASLITIAVMPFIALFFALDVPWYFSFSGVLQLVLIFAGNYLFVPVYGLEAAALTRLVTRAVLLFVTITIGMYYYRKQMRDDN